MNEFRKEFERLEGRFEDRSGASPREQNRYWPPIVVTSQEIDREVERLAGLPQPRGAHLQGRGAHVLDRWLATVSEKPSATDELDH